MTATHTERDPETKVDRRFVDRWSPRSFDGEAEIPDEDLAAIFEAARWAPSCFNEQPWTFLVAKRVSEDFARFLEPLMEGNRVWARKAAALVYVTARRQFAAGPWEGRDNAWRDFDTGSAWMSAILQAAALGYVTHGMAGFDKDAARRILGVPETHEMVAVLAVGKQAPADALPENLRDREAPSGRKDLSAIYAFGRWAKPAEG